MSEGNLTPCSKRGQCDVVGATWYLSHQSSSAETSLTFKGS